MAENEIINPFDNGSQVVIPEGTPIRTTHPSGDERHAGRSQTITVHHVGSGWVDSDRHYGTPGLVKFPTVTWPGSGGYWCTVQVTPELAAANGVSLPEPPGQDGMLHHTHLDVIPSYDDGYTDRWEF